MFYRSCLAAALSAAPLMAAQPLAESPLPTLPVFDAARAAFSQTGDLSLGHGNGDLSISRFEMRSVLSRPLSPAEGLLIIPMAEYSLTSLDFDGPPGAFPSGDEDLHAVGLSALILSMRNDSPWIYAGWARAELASDFRHINGDDFTFDLAAVVGYRFNDCFMLALGAAVINLNGDSSLYPAIAFDWTINEKIRLGLYGPSLEASYTPNDDWVLSLRGESAGGVWNVTGDAGESRSIDLTSYRVGLYASRRLTGEFWLTAGAGAVVGNEIDYTRPSGSRIAGRDLDAGMFGSLALRLRTW